MDKHYHPAVWAQLQRFATASDWDGMVAYLDGLSHSNFRTAGYLIGERIMMSLEEDSFWTLFALLYAHDTRAYLVTMLKSVCGRMKLGTVSLHHPRFLSLAPTLGTGEVDCQKTLAHLLPMLADATEVEFLLDALGVKEPQKRLAHLLRAAPSVPVYYVLLHTLHYVEHDRALLIRTTHYLMKRGDGLSFSLASLVRAVFGLEEVRGTFSLRLQPYELSRIEHSYEAFEQALRS